MAVPLLDLKGMHGGIERDLEAAALRVVHSGAFVLGPEVAAFEAAFAKATDAAHCAGVANGLDALTLGLRALGVGPGDEVVVPSNTYIATWLAVSAVGAVPVPVEPDPATHNLDADGVAARITPRTRAVLPVHLYGIPCDVPALREALPAEGPAILDDCAQAHGARVRGQAVGSLADVSAWSFYPSKNLGALGDAGAVTTGDGARDASVRLLRNYGSRQRYHNDVLGVNSRLDEMQAALLRAKLPHLARWNEDRRRTARTYLRRLAGVPGLGLPEVPAHAEPVWHLFVVRHAQRDALAGHLRRAGVETQVHYPVPPHLQPCYAGLGWTRGSFPVAERLADEVLSLPMGPTMTDADRDAVIGAIESFRPPGAGSAA